jgi:hypothetical protein
MDFRFRGESTRGLIVRWAQRPTGQARVSRAAASPGRLASRAWTEQDEHIEHEQECEEQQYRCHWFPPEGGTEECSGPVGSEAMFAIRSPERVDPVDRPLLASIMKYTFTCSMINKVLL